MKAFELRQLFWVPRWAPDDQKHPYKGKMDVGKSVFKEI